MSAEIPLREFTKLESRLKFQRPVISENTCQTANFAQQSMTVRPAVAYAAQAEVARARRAAASNATSASVDTRSQE